MIEQLNATQGTIVRQIGGTRGAQEKRRRGESEGNGLTIGHAGDRPCNEYHDFGLPFLPFLVPDDGDFSPFSVLRSPFIVKRERRAKGRQVYEMQE